MKLVNTLVFVTTAALLCGASYRADAAASTTPATDTATRPVLLAQAVPNLRSQDVVVQQAARGPGERGAQAAAAKGPEALRRYVDRTRMVYALQYGDFVRE